jgi:hypothetical protein
MRMVYGLSKVRQLDITKIAKSAVESPDFQFACVRTAPAIGMVITPP